MAQNLPLQFIVKTALTALLGFNTSVFGQRLLSANLKPQNENQVICGAPGYLCSYLGNDVRLLQTTIPTVGGWNSNDAVVYDRSFPSANRNPIIRCTDAFTETSHPYFSFAGGQGRSGD